MTTTVNRRDIFIRESLKFEEAWLSETGRAVLSSWEANLDGRLTTGETVDMTRYGKSFATALANLEAAIHENGWEIK